MKPEVRRKKQRTYQAKKRSFRKRESDNNPIQIVDIRRRKRTRKSRQNRRIISIKDKPENGLKRYRELYLEFHLKWETYLNQFLRKGHRNFDGLKNSMTHPETEEEFECLDFICALEEFIMLSRTYCFFHPAYSNGPNEYKHTWINPSIMFNGKKDTVKFARACDDSHTVGISILSQRFEILAEKGIYEDDAYYKYFAEGAFMIDYEDIQEIRRLPNDIRETDHIIIGAVLYHNNPRYMDRSNNLIKAGFDVSSFKTVTTVQSSERRQGVCDMMWTLSHSYNWDPPKEGESSAFIDIEKRILLKISFALLDHFKKTQIEFE